MAETVTKEMVLELLDQIQREIKESSAEIASLKTELRAINSECDAASKKLALLAQSRLAKGQPDPDE